MGKIISRPHSYKVQATHGFFDLFGTAILFYLTIITKCRGGHHSLHYVTLIQALMKLDNTRATQHIDVSTGLDNTSFAWLNNLARTV